MRRHLKCKQKVPCGSLQGVCLPSAHIPGYTAADLPTKTPPRAKLQANARAAIEVSWLHFSTQATGVDCHFSEPLLSLTPPEEPLTIPHPRIVPPG